MNNRRTQNIDGFALRRRPEQPVQSNSLGVENLAVPSKFLATAHQVDAAASPTVLPTPKQHSQANFTRSELDASLNEIDAPVAPPKRRLQLNKKFFKRALLIVLTLLVIAGGYLGIKAVIAGGRVFNGSLFDLLGSGKELKKDSLGRTNILVFGTSEDDPSHEDAAPNLADSIMVVSLDQTANNAAMVSVPRDLYVKYGEACNSGYQGRINEVYECGSDQGANEKAGSEKLMGIVSETYGLEIQYYVHVNYTVLRESVDAVNGVTVEIDSDDPRGILDRNFDWKCRYQCYYVKWPNGPANLDGEQALALARARNAAGGYGLGGGNFDREQYQQKIMIALKDKAVSSGTLANPVAVNGLINSLGNNVRTNFETGEIKTLIKIASEINNESIKRISLVETGSAVLTTGNVNGASIVRPIEGLYDYSKIQSYIRSQLTNDGTGESSSIEVLNGSDFGGVAGKQAEKLQAAGLGGVTTGDTPSDSSYAPLSWYDTTGGKKPKTLAKLREVLGTEPRGAILPGGVQSDADFVILLGNGSN